MNSRRRLLLTAASLPPALHFSLRPARAQDLTLALSSFGVSQDLLRKNLYTPFETRERCRIVVDAGNTADRLAKLEARKANPEIDVAALSDATALEAAIKELIEPIDVKRLKNFGRLFETAQNPIGNFMGVGYTWFATSIAYRKDKVRIDSWRDLWKPELKGRIALPNITTSQGPTMLLMLEKAWGGSSPDFANGIARLSEIKGNVVTFYERAAQVVQLFQQDEVHAAVIGRFNWPLVRKLNMPIAWAEPKEGVTGGINVLTVVKGARNKDLAYRFIDEWLGTEAQTRLANDLVDSPVNRDVKLAGEVAETLTYGADTAKRLNLITPTHALSRRANWVAAWNARIAR